MPRIRLRYEIRFANSHTISSENVVTPTYTRVAVLNEVYIPTIKKITTGKISKDSKKIVLNIKVVPLVYYSLSQNSISWCCLLKKSQKSLKTKQ